MKTATDVHPGIGILLLAIAFITLMAFAVADCPSAGRQQLPDHTTTEVQR